MTKPSLSKYPDSHHLAFLKDIKLGLGAEQKFIPSKYLYDDQGSNLFNQITRHPDYYLTRCEIENMQRIKVDLGDIFSAEGFNLVELGPGEGIKTEILIQQALINHLDFDYCPIDISKIYLDEIKTTFEKKLFGLQINIIHADFFEGLTELSKHSTRKKLVLFLGSNIGNLDQTVTLDFFKHLNETLNSGDYLLIGYDLHKNKNILMRAYDDSDGITRAFNLNLLERINKELGADFNLAEFQHRPRYNRAKDAMESYIVSLKEQMVHIRDAKQQVLFKANEAIYVEMSQKYHLEDMHKLATTAGFLLIKDYLDSKQYFANSLWQLKK